jgi:hypothetical protein
MTESALRRAIKNIQTGAEITYDYGRDYLTNINTRRGRKCDKCRNEPMPARRHAPKADEPNPDAGGQCLLIRGRKGGFARTTDQAARPTGPAQESLCTRP